LTQVASVLRRARVELTETDPPPALRDVAENIEKCLEDNGEPVDQALAEFAGELARRRLGRQT
jgi:DNA-directed RNA polymerase subunit L